MCASLLSTLRAGPPPPKVALLPDGLFFTRAVPITAGATAAEASAQVELALEAVSPFPLTQLFYGHFWTPGAEHALVFAAYRRRFTADQLATWEGAEVVLPTFAAVLGGHVEPGTTMVLTAPEGVTAIHWTVSHLADGAAAKTPAPTLVLFRSYPPEATGDDPEQAAARTAADRARVREELIRAIGGSKTVLEFAAPPMAEPSRSDRELVFRAGDFVSRLPATVAAALDVRDRGDLAAFRGARKRDVILWRVALGCAAGFLLLGLGELALQGGKQWQNVRRLKQTRQQPVVEKIMTSQALATRIDDLATKRLLPLEMISVISERKPADVQITRAYTKQERGLYTIFVDAKTSNSGQIPIFQSQLERLPVCERVETVGTSSRGDTTTTTLIVTFKPDSIKAAPPPS